MDFEAPRLLLDMYEVQDKLNIALDGPNWATATGHDYRLAMADEAMEIIHHVGWKWWKASLDPETIQVQLEVADIWHFWMSEILRDRPTSVGKFSFLPAREVPVFGECAVQARQLATTCLGAHSHDNTQAISDAFVRLTQAAALDLRSLYRLYMSKAQLNLFRWDHGYKEGTYKKVWQEVEDNVHLERFIAQHPNASGGEIYAHLASEYARLT